MKTVASHTRSFEASPKANEGDNVSFDRLDPNDPEWFYGSDADGTKEYFPLGWFDISEDGRTAVALRAYDAEELSLAVGTAFVKEEEYGGWILVSSAGKRGWIPKRCVYPDSSVMLESDRR